MLRLWRKIKRFFTRDYSKPANDYQSHGESENKPEFKPKWGIIIPHTKKKPGASGYSPYGQKIQEHEYGLKLAADTSFPFETRDNGGVYGSAKRLAQISQINATIEPHKNAYNKKAKGFELLVIKGDSLSGHYARMISEEFHSRFPDRRLRHDKGINWVKKGDRGYYNLVQAKKAGMEVAILGESFFIDNPNEWISPEEMAKFWNEVLV